DPEMHAFARGFKERVVRCGVSAPVWLRCRVTSKGRSGGLQERIRMTDLVYFAYGSNMLRERLDARCPNVRLLGNAMLDDHRLTFDQFSHVDDSGKGGIVPAPGEQVPGVLWTLPPGDLPALDLAESAGRGYERAGVTVTRAGGGAMEAITYRPIDLRGDLRPWGWYRALGVAGGGQRP